MKKQLILAAAAILVANHGYVFAEGINDNPEIAITETEVAATVAAPEGVEEVAANVDSLEVAKPEEESSEAATEAEAAEGAEVVESVAVEVETEEVGTSEAVTTAEDSSEAEPPSGVKLDPPSSPEDGEAPVGENEADNRREEYRIQLVQIYNELVEKRASGWKYPDDETGTLFDDTIKDVKYTIEIYERINIDLLRSIVGQLRGLIQRFEAPKPGETPSPGEQPKPEVPGTPETPAPEAPKSALPNTGDAEATAKLKSMTMEKPVSTMPATQSDNKQLPQTGETDSFAIFSAAALTILAGVGMLAYGKREEV